MAEPAPFTGHEDASAWLATFDTRFKKKNNSYKQRKFSELMQGDASSWHSDLWRVEHFVKERELFIAFWIDGFRGDDYRAKVKAASGTNNIAVNFVSYTPPLPPTPKPEPSSAHPLFSVLVSTGILDPRGVYDKALAQFTQAVDKEKVFRVIWDAAFETGKRVGISAGRGEVRSEAIEEGRQLGLAIVRRDAEEEKEKAKKQKEKNHHSTSVDTSDLIPSLMPSYVSLSTQTDVEIPLLPRFSEDKLNWADESDTIPPAVLIPPTTSLRDFSDLRTSSGTSRPFGLLQWRVHCSHRYHPLRKTQKNAFASSTQPTVPKPSSHIFTRSHPSGISQGKPTHTYWTPHAAPESKHGYRPPLGWVLDPRLVRLGQVLLDLGWIGH